ncbi:MAG: helix-turn-helix domain-containing protein [Caulobacteraceae bacterium]
MMKWLPEPEDALIGARIRRRREELGFTQSELGSLAGVTYQQVQKYERGDNRVSGSMLYRIAKALGASVQYFFQDLPDPASTTVTPGNGRVFEDHEGDILIALKSMTRKNRRLLLTIAEGMTAKPDNDDQDIDLDDDGPLYAAAAGA